MSLHNGAPGRTLWLRTSSGPFSPEANAALETIDEMVGILAKAIREQTPGAAITTVSYHGFVRVDHRMNLRTAILKAGLIVPNTQRTGTHSPAVPEWKPHAWAAGGSHLIMLKDRDDNTSRPSVGNCCGI